MLQSRFSLSYRNDMPKSKPGERKLQILQALATMLEHPKAEKITTALLAERVGVSEAALYRHFASKAQMYEGLIEFIENSVFTLINQIADKEAQGILQTHAICTMFIGFAERNPGMCRVITGDVLVYEDSRLQARMNQFFDRLELALKQSLRLAVTQGHCQEAEVQSKANLLANLILARCLRFSKTEFKVSPAEGLASQITIILR